MREYRIKYPLEEIRRCEYGSSYKNLLKDASGLVISESITQLELSLGKNEVEVKTKILDDFVKAHCPKSEIVYEEVSGNRWLFLYFNGDPTKEELEQLQKTYEKAYDLNSKKWG
jgi:hypothetical protein